jgi:integrase
VDCFKRDTRYVGTTRLQPKSEGTIFGWRWYRKWFSKVCRAAKVANLRWHGLRHTYGSRLTADGIPLRHIMKLMGHRNLNTHAALLPSGPIRPETAVLRLDRFAGIGRPSDTGTDTGPSSETAARRAMVQ